MSGFSANGTPNYILGANPCWIIQSVVGIERRCSSNDSCYTVHHYLVEHVHGKYRMIVADVDWVYNQLSGTCHNLYELRYVGVLMTGQQVDTFER